MRKTSKIITALALAGIAVAGGAAFTASGVSLAPAAQASFGGGAVTESITGATVTGIAYTYETGTNIASNTAIATVAVTFADEPTIYGKTPTALLVGGAGVTGTGDALGTGSPALDATHLTVTFTSATGWVGANGLTITVPATS